MFHNYFFLKRLAAALHARLAGLSLLECFSQSKNELILGFGSEHDTCYLKASLEPGVSLLSFPDTFARAGRNSVDLFQRILDEEVKEVTAFSYDRSFQISFGDHALIFKMHGRAANILLAREDEVLEVFRNNLPADLELIPSSLHKNTRISWDDFQQADHDPLFFIPALGKEVKIHLENTGFHQLDPTKKWEAFKTLLETLEQNPITLLDGDRPRISLLNEESTLRTTDAIAAANWLYDTAIRKVHLEREKAKLVTALKQKIRKSESYLVKTETKLKEVKNQRSPEEIANIIMANLTQIQTGLRKAVLTDFYRNEPIEIKLNTDLSPQKNAENYYRKAKNRHQEIKALEKNMAAKEKIIDECSLQLLEIQELSDLKALKKYVKQHGLGKKQPVQPRHLPYHVFDIDGWQVLVGKNARSNDELTLKVATKNDLWLHARDVSGSHVVVRQRPGQNFPEYIIEKAASLAAHYSKRKTDPLCPVIYTLKKYVRKVKRAPAGQVVVDKEEVVMVEPGLLN